MEPEEAELLIAKSPRNRDVLFPYLNGEDLNSRRDQSPSRWVINFKDWPLNRTGIGTWHGSTEKERKEWLRSGIVPGDYPDPVATDYPDCLAIVEAKVKPERTRQNENSEFALRYPLFVGWWQYADKRPELYGTISDMPCVAVGVLHTKYWSVTLYEPRLVFSHALVVFALGSYAAFAVLQSSIHEAWTREHSGSLETRLRYTPSDCFDTFVFPDFAELEETGSQCYHHRESTLATRQEGLTTTYNRFHDPSDLGGDIHRLRELHVQMDRAVAAAYGWTNLSLNHDFHPTKQGVRFTISEPARRDILGRLVRLNHERYAEEVAQGMHDKKANKKTKSRVGIKSSDEPAFDFEEQEA